MLLLKLDPFKIEYWGILSADFQNGNIFYNSVIYKMI